MYVKAIAGRWKRLTINENTWYYFADEIKSVKPKKVVDKEQHNSLAEDQPESPSEGSNSEKG